MKILGTQGWEKLGRGEGFFFLQAEGELTLDDTMVIYMLPSNLNLNNESMKGYNNKILVSNTNMKIGSNRDINNDHKKLSITSLDELKKTVIPAAQHNLKRLA